MSGSLKHDLKAYDYHFPEELIADRPALPRDSARLFVYHKTSGKVEFGTFRNLSEYIPKGAVLVLNKTKVFPARLRLQKETGGAVKILYVRADKKYVYVLSDKHLRNGMKLTRGGVVYFTVVGKREAIYTLRPVFPIAQTMKVFLRYGETPIPPYIKNTPLSEAALRREYQTVFAKRTGSVAAPTASLHFTKRLLMRIKKSGCAVRFVTLHVNLGTFAPLTPKELETKRLHAEYYKIDKATAQFLRKAKQSGRPIIAVGTTVVRALESAADAKGNISKLKGETSLFIREGYGFKIVDGLITNFHVPQSSLLMLVAAFIGRNKILELYKEAITKKFRLFSFGDGMLILGSKIPSARAQ